MKKTTLLANGCSWTYGGGLDRFYKDPEQLQKKVWPHHLQSLVGFDQCYNLAAGGGSNQRIVRTTINWILQQNKETLKNTTAVIQWTEWSRYEYYVPRHVFHEMEEYSERWALCKIGNCMSSAELDHSENLAYIRERNNKRYETFTDLEGYYNYINHCQTLSSIFEEYGIKYYYWNFNTPMFRLPEPKKSFLLNRYNWLEPEGRHAWIYERFLNEINPRVPDDPHPNEQGHVELAKHIKDAMFKLKYYG
jgi:lysophospholipase L1-like esterase